MIFLKMLCGPLIWVSSPSSIPVSLRFGLFIVSLISWIFSARINFWDLTFIFIEISHSSIMFSFALGMIAILGAGVLVLSLLLGLFPLGSCCPFWFLGVCGSCVLLKRKFFWDPDRCDHWKKVEYISRFWKLTLGNRDGLGSLSGFTGGMKAECSIRSSLVSW